MNPESTVKAVVSINLDGGVKLDIQVGSQVHPLIGFGNAEQFFAFADSLTAAASGHPALPRPAPHVGEPGVEEAIAAGSEAP